MEESTRGRCLWSCQISWCEIGYVGVVCRWDREIFVQKQDIVKGWLWFREKIDSIKEEIVEWLYKASKDGHKLTESKLRKYMQE